MKKNPVSCYYIYMKEIQDEMIFTSISLPNWQLARISAILRRTQGQTIYSIIEYCVLKYLSKNLFKVARDQAHQYNKSPSKYEKISVYWKVDFYNKIRMKAHHSRMSASLIIHQALLACLVELLKESDTEEIADFISYQNIIFKLTTSTVRIMENMSFLHPPDS